ncbi:MAG: RNA polymerase sporulation sigma factor SigK [Clostridiales bacterium]|nr:RNA polymerase sporulation sigma factor SigK [Clostridiales bacterium]
MQNFRRTDSFPPKLSAEEEEKYICEKENGSQEAKNALIEHNIRLVAHIVKKYPNYQKETEDLISIGSIGLIKAVNTYNSEKKTRLSTYAARCIENEVLMHIRQNKKHRSDCYLQDTVGLDKDGNEVTLQDRIADDEKPVDEQVETKLEIHRLQKSIGDSLSDREKLILKMRYGLLGGDELTQREIAEILGISRSYVSRIEKKALSKLKAELDPQ